MSRLDGGRTVNSPLVGVRKVSGGSRSYDKEEGNVDATFEERRSPSVPEDKLDPEDRLDK